MSARWTGSARKVYTHPNGERDEILEKGWILGCGLMSSIASCLATIVQNRLALEKTRCGLSVLISARPVASSDIEYQFGT